MPSGGKGLRVQTGYIELRPEIVSDWNRQLESKILPKLKSTGKTAGDVMGAQMMRQIEEKVGKSSIPSRHLIDQGDKVGDQVGRKMAKQIEDKVGKVDLSKGSKGGFGLDKIMFGAAALGAGAVFFGKQFFDAASDMRESTTKAQVVFGDWLPLLVKFNENSAKAFGMSKQAALETEATFGNLFTAMEIDAGKAAFMSGSLVQLGGDLASFNNVNPEDALIALKAGLVGETEPLRRFGVNLNQARIEAEALRLGLVHGNVNMVDVQNKTSDVEKAQIAAAKATKEHGANSVEARDASANLAKAEADLSAKLNGKVPALDAAQKAEAAYSLIMKDTSNAQGDYARTADGAANKQRTLSATFEDFKAKVGEKLQGPGNWIIDHLSGGLDKVSGWFDEHGQQVEDGLGRVKTKFDDIFGPDPVENFKKGADIIEAKLDEIFGDDKRANFDRGADIVKNKFHEIFGEDPVANLRAGADEIAKTTSDLWANFEYGSTIIYDKIGPAWETLGQHIKNTGDIAMWLKDEVLDPLIGTLQTVGDKLDEVRGGQSGFDAPFLGTGIDAVKGASPLGWLLGFDDGGRVGGGQVGDPALIKAHVGEIVLPAHKGPQAVAQVMQQQGISGGGLSIGDMNFYGVRERETAWDVRRALRTESFFAGGR